MRYAATPLRGERDKRRHKALQTLQQMKRILNKEKDGVCVSVHLRRWIWLSLSLGEGILEREKVSDSPYEENKNKSRWSLSHLPLMCQNEKKQMTTERKKIGEFFFKNNSRVKK